MRRLGSIFPNSFFSFRCMNHSRRRYGNWPNSSLVHGSWEAGDQTIETRESVISLVNRLYYFVPTPQYIYIFFSLLKCMNHSSRRYGNWLNYSSVHVFFSSFFSFKYTSISLFYAWTTRDGKGGACRQALGKWENDSSLKMKDQTVQYHTRCKGRAWAVWELRELVIPALSHLCFVSFLYLWNVCCCFLKFSRKHHG